MGKNTKKKVLFLITKSNWGEKVWETFARPCQLSLECNGKVATRCTASVRREAWDAFARPCLLFLEVRKEMATRLKQNQYSVSEGCQLFLKKIAATYTASVRRTASVKTAPSRPFTNPQIP